MCESKAGQCEQSKYVAECRIEDGEAMASAAGPIERNSTPTKPVYSNHVKRKHCALDFDTLECPICLEPLFPPVFQCQNGHATCEGCCKKLPKGSCPTCSRPIGSIRCIALEKIIESLQVNCKYAPWGCKEMLHYTRSKRHHRKHEELCAFRPYHCPVVCCNHLCPKLRLRQHFHLVHNGSLLEVLRPNDERKVSFTIDGAYDKSWSQYVLLEALEYEAVDSENESLFLIHHQFQEKFCRYSFSCTSFGACKTVKRYHLGVSFERSGGFKENHCIEGPIHDNQKDSAVLSKVVRLGDCLLVPKLYHDQKDGPLFDVELSLL